MGADLLRRWRWRRGGAEDGVAGQGGAALGQGGAGRRRAEPTGLRTLRRRRAGLRERSRAAAVRRRGPGLRRRAAAALGVREDGPQAPRRAPRRDPGMGRGDLRGLVPRVGSGRVAALLDRRSRGDGQIRRAVPLAPTLRGVASMRRVAFLPPRRPGVERAAHARAVPRGHAVPARRRLRRRARGPLPRTTRGRRRRRRRRRPLRVARDRTAPRDGRRGGGVLGAPAGRDLRRRPRRARRRRAPRRRRRALPRFERRLRKAKPPSSPRRY